MCGGINEWYIYEDGKGNKIRVTPNQHYHNGAPVTPDDAKFDHVSGLTFTGEIIKNGTGMKYGGCETLLQLHKRLCLQHNS